MGSHGDRPHRQAGRSHADDGQGLTLRRLLREALAILEAPKLTVLASATVMVLGISACGAGQDGTSSSSPTHASREGVVRHDAAVGVSRLPTANPPPRRAQAGRSSSSSSRRDSRHQADRGKPSVPRRTTRPPRMPARVEEPIRLSPGQVERGHLQGRFEGNDKRLRRANPSTPERKQASPR